MRDPACSGETSRDLFGDMPYKRLRSPITSRRIPPELVSARALCAQLRRAQALPDKQRIVHLICLNLVSMLKNGTRR